jgi:hypothetical protein
LRLRAPSRVEVGQWHCWRGAGIVDDAEQPEAGLFTQPGTGTIGHEPVLTRASAYSACAMSIRSLHAVVAVLGTAVVLGALVAGPVFAQPDGGGCAPVQAGWDGVFVQPTADACTGNAFVRAEDVHDLMTAGQSPDGYVLVSDVRRDDNGQEALVLVKPWSFER